MKVVKEISSRKTPIVAIDTSLDKYRATVLFPKKLDKANKMLKTAKLPLKKHRS